MFRAYSLGCKATSDGDRNKNGSHANECSYGYGHVTLRRVELYMHASAYLFMCLVQV